MQSYQHLHSHHDPLEEMETEESLEIYGPAAVTNKKDSTSNKVEDEKQYPMVSSDFPMYYMFLTQRWSLSGVCYAF